MNQVLLTHRLIDGVFVRARKLDESGEFEAAIAEMNELWDGLGTAPRVLGLSDSDAAELLLRSGSLTGQLGSARQIAGSQDAAMDLLTRAEERFLRIGMETKISEVRAALALCYWRNGSFDEARAVLRDALRPSLGAEARLGLLIALAVMEWQEGHGIEALTIYSECGPLCDLTESPYLIGKFHMNFAIALKAAGLIDQALIESAAASYYMEQAEHLRCQARIINNTAMMLMTVARFDEAHENVNRAENLFKELEDRGSLAQICETRAQIYLAENQCEKAEEQARAAVSTLSAGDEKAVLVDALTTQGIALARLKRTWEALSCFSRAGEVARFISAASAAKVKLTLVEELAGDAYLGNGIDFYGAIKRIEAELIKEALDQSGGRVTEASLRLGMTHQALCWALGTRHQALQPNRAMLRPRRAKTKTKKGRGKVLRIKRASGD